VLFYLAEWLASGFGLAGPAWAWRLLPAACGAAAVLVVYATARPLAGPAGALAGGLAMAISPTGIYFSQEARSSSMVLLLAAVALLLAGRLAVAPRRAAWLAYGALCLVGIATNYFFVIVPAAQLAVLLALRPTRRAAAICVAVVALVSLPALALAYHNIQRVIGAGAPPPPMSVVQLAEGPPAASRYGTATPGATRPCSPPCWPWRSPGPGRSGAGCRRWPGSAWPRSGCPCSGSTAWRRRSLPYTRSRR
jgi:hypothetical protein